MSDMELGDLEIIVHTPDARTHKVDAPANIKVEELIQELVRSLGLTEMGRDDRETPWSLFDKTLGVQLDIEKTLQENGVKDGHTLYIDRRAAPTLIELKVYFPDGTVSTERVSPEQSTKEFIADLVARLVASGRTAARRVTWSLNNKDTGGALDPERTLQENRVLSGHHLYLQETPIVIPWVAIAAAGLAVAVLLGVAWRSYHPGPPPVPVTVRVDPATIKLSPGGQEQLTVTITGSENHAVRWSVSPEIGSISEDGLYTAPPTIATETSVTITATSQANPASFASASVVVTPPLSTSAIAVQVNPANLSLGVRETGTFTASVTGVADSRVKWSLEPNIGTISGQGVYTAPPSISSQQTITVTAVSEAASNVSGLARVALKPVTLKLLPATASLSASGMTKFSVTVDGTSDKAVTWSVTGPGTISAGTYQAPPSVSSGQTVTVKATSHADPSKSATAIVTLTPVVAVNLIPPTATLGAAQTQTFSASISGSTNQSIIWTTSGPGTITNGTYAAPTSISSSTQVHVTATSAADSTKTATATINLIPLSINVTPSRAELRAGQTAKFSASISGSSNTAVVWSLSGPGTVAQDGAYTAPPSVPAAQSARVTATSSADSSRSDSAQISLIATNTTTTGNPSTTTNASPKTPRVCFYRDSNYGPWEQCQYPGDEISSFGPHNDQISSIRIFNGARVVVWDQKDFKGRNMEVSSDMPDLKQVSGKSWSDQIKSARVMPMGSPGADRVCVYDQPDYGGHSRCWSAGREVADLAVDGEWSDKISSIQVIGRAVLQVFRDVDFKAGDTLRIDTSIPDLRQKPLESVIPSRDNLTWNRQISSFRVLQR